MEPEAERSLAVTAFLSRVWPIWILPEPALQIGEVLGRQAEDRHDLARHGDVEACFAREAVGGAAERGDDLAQRPVVHVDGAAPGHPAGVDVELVAPIDVIVDQRREQIVGGADGMEVAGEMEVDVLHRHDLGIAAAGSAALHAEAGAEARLAHADDRLLADMIERIAKARRWWWSCPRRQASGVMAVTRISLPSGRPASEAI